VLEEGEEVEEGEEGEEDGNWREPDRGQGGRASEFVLIVQERMAGCLCVCRCEFFVRRRASDAMVVQATLAVRYMHGPWRDYLFSTYG
jgi:hypothetical protein